VHASLASLSRGVLPPLCITLTGLLPLAAGERDPHVLASWLALVAPALGVLAGARSRGGTLLLPLLFWIVALAFANARAGAGGLPRADLAGLALAGLFGLGAIAGAARRPPAWRASALALIATGLFALLPTGGGALAEPWPPALAARLLDLSPVGVVLECGGVDWMRDPSIYEAAGTTSIPPDLRGAWEGARAAPLLAAIVLAGFVLVRSLGSRARHRDHVER
jgi:hypothetical protein